jgi:hypothetical protein
MHRQKGSVKKGKLRPPLIAGRRRRQTLEELTLTTGLIVVSTSSEFLRISATRLKLHPNSYECRLRGRGIY